MSFQQINNLWIDQLFEDKPNLPEAWEVQREPGGKKFEVGEYA